MNHDNEIRNFVSREVIYCVSGLISSLAKSLGNGCEIEGFTDEDYYAICVQDDYETPVAYYIHTHMNDEELCEYLANVYSLDYESEIKHLSTLMLAQKLEGYVRENNHWQEFADEFQIDPETVEAYEHWIVTDWMAKRLEEKGEMVAYDICGLTIWGRTTTGQAIYMDSVIQEIYKELQ